MVKISRIDFWIITFCFFLLPIDMVNGVLLHNNVNLPLSVSQLYKVIILFILLFRVLTIFLSGTIILALAFLLSLSTIYQSFFSFTHTNVLVDVIKIMRYILPVLSFMFFSNVLKKGSEINEMLIFRLVKFSYYFLIINVLLKYLGLGYPMYPYGNIGSKGFFYAGNEISALLIILSSILAKQIWLAKKKRKYIIFFILNIIVGLTLTSKTGILGIILVFFLIPLKPINFNKVSLKRIKQFFLVSFLFIATIFLSWEAFKSSPVFLRFTFFWNKLDIITFVFSNRNVFAEQAWSSYIQDYDFVEKIIGAGQSKFENLSSIIEIDILDIFFAYGFLGIFSFIFLMGYLYITNKIYRKRRTYVYANLVKVMILILLLISTMAGHVFSSGMSGVFIGLLFSLMYYDKDERKTSEI